ncbi:HupE/UreJ family protein [Methylobacterium sp. NEAU 140]|uniref:HupE/UreJ family protein n=1 Tax=Methylobacterium sp. NEAU 140 TaxID=3064945 RepID=UPI00273746F6|nr:HupE/UreJ family protein [Methylobacterium sp. NEAU 140]MDP4021932.1 HupE/UreJ family protein [Methylobacterium sp. NEAU 140]
MKRLLPLAAALLLLPQAALAHPGHGAATGAEAGFLHPLLGADHVLAMVAVGLLAALRGGRALWALPAAFLTLMTVGAGLGMAGVALPYAETGIALSIVAFGLAAMVGLRAPVAALAALVGGFALFHGHAHGAEMPETASGLAYGLGFLAATAGLHAAGIGLGLAGARLGTSRAAPALGAGVAAAGLALMALPA